MFQVSEYFDGKVKSLSFQAQDSRATVGVMAPGEYEFGTAQKEVMTVTSGALNVRLPGAADFQIITAGQSFTVVANSKFQAKVETDTSYLCLYLDS